jgi:hypothetical protein
MGETGGLTVDTAAQIEGDAEGRAWVLESGVQYQLSERLQCLVEAVLFERRTLDGGERASGFGDTDLTLSWLATGGGRAFPSIVLAAKVKVPAAGPGLGTGKADLSLLAVAGRELGELELNLETELATFGQWGGETLREQFLYTFTAEYALNDFLAVYAEAFGNSAPTAAESRTDAARIGLELDFDVSAIAAPYLSLEADTEGTRAARAGVEWTW